MAITRFGDRETDDGAHLTPVPAARKSSIGEVA